MPEHAVVHVWRAGLTSSDHMKIHVKNTACSYWNFSNLFSDWEQVQPIFGTLGGLTILCGVIYGGTVADGLSITVQPQFSAEPGLFSLCPPNPRNPSHHLHRLWSRSTSLEFALGHPDSQLEELLSEIRWEHSLNSTMHCMAVSQCTHVGTGFKNPVKSS